MYTGAEKGKKIKYPGRVGTIDLEAGAQKAIARRVAKFLANSYNQRAVYCTLVCTLKKMSKNWHRRDIIR